MASEASANGQEAATLELETLSQLGSSSTPPSSTSLPKSRVNLQVLRRSGTDDTHVAPNGAHAAIDPKDCECDGCELPSADPEELLDTTETLQRFQTIKNRLQRHRDQIANTLESWVEENEDTPEDAILKKLRDWAEYASANSHGRFNLFTHGKLPTSLPDHADLQSLARHHFPCLGDLKVRIIDFSYGYARRHQTTLQNIDKCRNFNCCTGALANCYRDRPETQWSRCSLDVSITTPKQLQNSNSVQSHVPLGVGIAHSVLSLTKLWYKY